MPATKPNKSPAGKLCRAALPQNVRRDDGDALAPLPSFGTARLLFAARVLVGNWPFVARSRHHSCRRRSGRHDPVRRPALRLVLVGQEGIRTQARVICVTEPSA